MARKTRKARFDPKEFLSTVDGDRTVVDYRKNEIIFSQGDPADAVFYVQTGKVKIVVTSEQGREAVVAVPKSSSDRDLAKTIYERAVVPYRPLNWEREAAKIARLRALRLDQADKPPRKLEGPSCL